MGIKEIRIDGYKNLIDSRVPLGDFNVIVGPNNSGKSNLLEVLSFLCYLCFRDDDDRKAIFSGNLPWGAGSSIPHLEGHETKPLSIGLTLEVAIRGLEWRIEYDVCITRHPNSEVPGGFFSEILKAKPVSRTGQPKTYLDRREEVLKVHGKEHPIEKGTAAFTAIPVLYPRFNGLPAEHKDLQASVLLATFSQMLAISPGNLREAIGTTEELPYARVTSFDLLSVIDKIQRNPEEAELFKSTVCDILDLENLSFKKVEIRAPGTEGSDKSNAQYARYCFLKRWGGEYSPLAEFSDGTLIVLAIAAAAISLPPGLPLLAIEEPENGLHPQALQKLLRFVQRISTSRPVILTTHSPYLLNGVDPGDIIVAVVDEAGATHFERPGNKKAIDRFLKQSYMSFGDLLVTNFQDLLQE